MTQHHKLTFRWFRYSFWLWFFFQQVYCDYVSWSFNKKWRDWTWLCDGIQRKWILRGSASIVSQFMTNMKRYTALCVYTGIILNQLVGFVRAPLLRVVPVKLRYGDATFVTYEQPQFLPLSRSNIQTIEINVRSGTGELVSFESGKSIVTLFFRRKSLFHWCINYQHLKKQYVKEIMVLAVSPNDWQELLYLLWRRVFWI